MEKESPESLRIFLPSTLIALSLLIYFCTEVSGALRERSNLAAAFKVNEEQLAHREKIGAQLEKVAGSLFALSKTNETAALLVKKHKIQYREPAPAPQAP